MKKNIQNCLRFVGAICLLASLQGYSQVSLTEASNAASQDFNTLASSGTNAWTDNSVLSGWYANHTGLSNYLIGTGSAVTGGLYSFGASAATDRALGSVCSNGTGAIRHGVRVKNNGASNITSLTVAYTGEQWRNGGNTTAHKLDFAYSNPAATVTSVTVGTFIDLNTLDFTGPIATATTAALDGNAAANRTVIAAQTITVTIPAGQEIMLRWEDLNDTGNDHGLAVDDLTVTATFSGSSTDVPPTVSSTIPANNAMSVAVAATITINFSEAVDVAASAFSVSPSVTFTTSPALPATNVTSVVLTPSASLANATAYTVATDATKVTDKDGTADQMAANNVFSFTTIAAPGACAVTNLISAIQGSGSTAALTGTRTIQGIVVSDFQNVTGTTNLGGFYVQEETADSDGNPATSEGIFVFEGTGAFLTNVAVGDRVCITGTVAEFTSSTSSLTQMTVSAAANIVVSSSGNALPAATSVQLPVANVSDLERYEGMLVNLSASTGNLVVTENFQLGRFGQLILATNGSSNQTGTDARLDQYTQYNLPSTSGYATYLADIAKRRIYLDDGRGVQNPDPIIFGRGGNPLSAANTLRGGDEVATVAGILDERFEGYRIQTLTSPNFLATNARSTTPPSVGASTLKVASFNVLNYFNGNGSGGGFPTPRGANNAAEFTRQRDKIISAIVGTGADVLGLMELEDDGYGSASAIQDLVNGLNAVAGAGTYTFVNPGDISSDEITVGIVYKPAAVELVGAAAAIPFAFGTGSFTVVGRRSLAQTIKQKSNNEIFTLVVSHFKSKGSSSGGAGDADANDGQALSNGTRTRQATDLKDWLATKPTGTNDTDYLVLGDLNAYSKEDPLTTLATAGYNNLLPAASYSYVFDGQTGSLDHALGTGSLASQMTGADDWHINADEPTALDYNTEFKTAGQVTSLYNTSPFRSSDHDAILIGLNLQTCISPVAFNVTGGGTICNGVGVAVGLSNSETGVTYQLKNGATNVGSPVSGTGATLAFGNQTTAGTYSVEATRTSGSCVGMMLGTAVVALPQPTLNLTLNINSGTIVYVADQITAINQVMSSTVEYRGAQSVMLQPGFVASGNVFRAFIGGCN